MEKHEDNLDKLLKAELEKEAGEIMEEMDSDESLQDISFPEDLDEPSIGLHQRDNDKLLATLKHLRDLGNTLIVVEHDEDTMFAADQVIDIGPGAGEHGGELVAQGTA